MGWKIIWTIVIILGLVLAFYFGYLLNNPKSSQPAANEENSQLPALPSFKGPTSSPNGIKGPSGPPPR